MTDELKKRFKTKLERIRDNQEVINAREGIILLTETELKAMINATLGLMHDIDILQQKVTELEERIDGTDSKPKYSTRDKEPKYSKSEKKDSGYLSFLQ